MSEEPVVNEAETIVANSVVGQLSRIADAIFELGAQSVQESEVTYLTLANECVSIHNAMEEILSNARLNALQKFTNLRKLSEMVLKQGQQYAEEYENQALQEVEDNEAEDSEEDNQ